ncbi:hypothetical protein OCS_03747 [Ophiocordyceps sinensis CO18]|uniref:Uncharacterized protein n=1 Tax=Ophiocordyceps sinensis (strain Co18 / CGMCC 3.14243) TaxID=911162 RepID=T5ADQ0_OPHSC|nr:hypothetical protein OCS_03747 [Ophiocordyceps sinensis CO18]
MGKNSFVTIPRVCDSVKAGNIAKAGHNAKATLALALALVSLGSLANVAFLALPSSNNSSSRPHKHACSADSSKSASCCKAAATAARFAKPAKPTPCSEPTSCSDPAVSFARPKLSQQLFGLLFRPSKQLIKLLFHKLSQQLAKLLATHKAAGPTAALSKAH